MKAIELENIHKSFGGREVLKNIGFSIEEREIFGLLGPSGAGKTTLIKIMTGQLAASGGEARIIGQDSRKLKENHYREIGMVMDNSGVYERLSLCDNLKIFADIYKLNRNSIEEALELVGLSESANIPAGKVSKGMKQRLVLARAILHKPVLLFLDEPTSGLDPAAAAAVHELLLKLREKGTTIFLTTHNMEEATELCDHIALLHEGNIIEYGEPVRICRKYNHKNEINIILKDDRTLQLDNSAENAERIGGLFRQGAVVSIHSSEPDLEQVFLKLTGRGLE